jgi:hypothetical protein
MDASLELTGFYRHLDAGVIGKASVVHGQQD